jgi:REP element-mobilizing transposase RayT
MGRTYTQLLNHVVFSTKERRPFLTVELRDRLFPYIGGVIRHLDGVPLLINGVADHVHLLARVPAKIAVSELVGKIKSNASKWVHETFAEHWDFAWQLGFAAFSVSCSQKQSVLDYIGSQEEHHRKISFKEELIAFLKKHEIEYDKRYIFE